MGGVREIHGYMKDGRRVVLDDGRQGRILRVDTRFPNGPTTVAVWVTSTERGPGVAYVRPTEIVGPAVDGARSA